MFFQTPQPARSCRTYVYGLALRLGVPVKGGSLPEGIEIFPKHDRLRPGEFGDAIRGPLGIHRGSDRRYWFYGADYKLEKQMAYLKQVPKVSGAQLEALIAGKVIPPDLEGQKSQGEATRIPSRNGTVVNFGSSSTSRRSSARWGATM